MKIKYISHRNTFYELIALLYLYNILNKNHSEPYEYILILSERFCSEDFQYDQSVPTSSY